MKTNIKTIAAIFALAFAFANTSAGAGDLPNPILEPALPQAESLLYTKVKPQYMLSNDTHDGNFGGEVSIGTTFFEFADLQFSAGYLSTESEIQNYTVDAVCSFWEAEVYEVPVSAYGLVGGGIYTNSSNGFLGRVGLGLEFDVMPDNFLDSVLFVEGVYNFVTDDIEDYLTIGAGIKFFF